MKPGYVFVEVSHPGRDGIGPDVKVHKPKNQTNKFCVKCLKSTRLLVHCGQFTQRRGS